MTCWYYDEDGKAIHRDSLPLEWEARQKILRETARRNYEDSKNHRGGELVAPEFRKFVRTIVNSFNSDHSNSQVDYFDRGFYEDFTWKIV